MTLVDMVGGDPVSEDLELEIKYSSAELDSVLESGEDVPLSAQTSATYYQV